MRAVRFERDGTVKFVQVPNPQPGPEDVLVQVLAAGVCHTDLHLLDEVKAGNHDPLIPGHEIAGRVAKVGSDVYASNVGDRVVVHFEQPCGQCRQCKRMRTNLCENGTTLGFDAPGGYAEFVVAKQTTVLPVPPNLEPALAAPLGCSGATAYRSVVALGQAGEGDLAVVIGAGGEAEARRHPRAAALRGRNGAERPARREDCGSGRAVPRPDGSMRLATETRERGASMISAAT